LEQKVLNPVLPDMEVQRGYTDKVLALSEEFALREGRYPRACVRTFGCQMNEHDSEKLRGMLHAMGYELLPDYDANTRGEIPDVVILNTCCVRENAEDRVYGHLGALKGLKAKQPGMIIGVCGCMTEQAKAVEKIRSSYRHVDLVFGTGNSYRLPEFIYGILTKHVRMIGAQAEDSLPEGVPALRDDKYKAYVTVMYGCNNFCTYCIVPYVRGRERSRRADDIVAEVKQLAEAGTMEVMLLGQNVNSYGKKSGDNTDFPALLRRLCRETSIPRFRFMTSHPKDISDALIEAISEEPAICAQLHLPVQSGSTSELRRMNRVYTREKYLERVEKVRQLVPDITLTTDIMIGFPGETEEEFEDTLSLLEQVRFDAAYTFIYSPRTGTPAASWPDQVPEEVVKERFARLTELQNRISLEKNLEMIGSVQEVLVEGRSKTDLTKFTGRTAGNKIVNFTADVPAEADTLAGTLRMVNIDGAQTWSLEGRLCL